MKYINTFADLATYSASTGSFSFPHVAFAVQEEQVKYDADPSKFYNFWGTVVNGTTSAPSININGNIGGEKCDGYYWFVKKNNISRFSFESKSPYKTINRLENSTSDGIIHYNNQYGNFGGLFKNMTNLEYVDVSKIDTSAVNGFLDVFSHCEKLVEINGIENLNTSASKNFNNTFFICKELPSLDLSNWVTSGITEMISTFKGCAKMTTLNLSNWDMSRVIQYTQMFFGCSSLTSIIANNTNQTTLEKIQNQLVTDSVASHVTITRDGYNWTYSGGQWVSTPV